MLVASYIARSRVQYEKYFSSENQDQVQQELSYLLTNFLPNITIIVSKSARNNLTYFQTFDSFLFLYFNLNILYSVHLFCIRWSFVIDLFWNVLFQKFDYF